ncbi:hypothetical protein CTI12_AA192040 [Artemisia annua]|uniref:Helitron helicase-like domain-containing protein n=1 Tax=Artemisia annua TaxID=35608 RepID=A0A2U1P5M9_ARTAN|nr:hypothetical protein CTI12_AA192040 [Artemisia annua]
MTRNNDAASADHALSRGLLRLSGTLVLKLNELKYGKILSVLSIDGFYDQICQVKQTCMDQYQIKHYILGVSYLLPSIGFLPRVSSSSQEIEGQQHLCGNVFSDQTSASGSTSRQPNDPPPLKVQASAPSTLCIDHYFAQSKRPTRKRKKNDAQRPATCTNEFVASHKGYNDIDVAPHPQPTHQHSFDCNTELHDTQETVAHHVVSQGLNPSTGCPSSTSNVSLQDEFLKNKRPKIIQHTRFQSSQRAGLSIPQNETHANNNEVTDCHRDQTSASGNTQAHTNNNEVTDCHRGGQCTDVVPNPQAPQHHATTSNTEARESHQDANNHFAAENLHSREHFSDEVFKNKRPKIPQHTRFQSSQRADAGILQNEAHTNNNEVTDCRRGGQCTDVAADPQAPQHHATTSNTEAHESHQDANNHFAAENLHSREHFSPVVRLQIWAKDFLKINAQKENNLPAAPQLRGPLEMQRTMYANVCSALDPQIVQGLIHFFDTHNELVQMLRAARDLSDQPDVPEFKLKLYNAEGARGYELPTSNTLAAIVFDSGPMSESDFDVIIQYKGGEPQRINKLHKSYMSMQFPLIFIYGQPGFHAGLMSRPTAPNKKPRRVSLNAFYTYQLHPRPHTYDLLFRTGRLFQHALDPQIVQGLIHFFDTHNELVQVLRAARDLSDQPDVPEFKLKLYNAEGARGYELPTSNTLAATVFDSGPMSESDFDVIIQYKGGEPQRINKLHKSYMSMQFPLIFIYGQPGFHTGLMSRPTAPNKRPRRVSLNAQMETTASTQQQTTTDDKTLAVTATSTQLAETASNEQPLQTAVPMQEVMGGKWWWDKVVLQRWYVGIWFWWERGKGGSGRENYRDTRNGESRNEPVEIISHPRRNLFHILRLKRTWSPQIVLYSVEADKLISPNHNSHKNKGGSSLNELKKGSGLGRASLENAERSDCKFLAEKIKKLEETLAMEMHLENHTRESSAILHELLNDKGKHGVDYMAANFKAPPVKKPTTAYVAIRGRIKARIFGEVAETFVYAISRAGEFFGFFKKDEELAHATPLEITKANGD